MMPGLGALCGAIPFEDVLRKSQAFAPLSKNQKIIINSLAFCIPIIAGLIGYGVFGTFSAIALGSASSALFHTFNPFARFRNKGFWSATGAAIITSPFLIILFAIMWLTGYGVLGKQKAIAMMSGIIGTALLSPTTPALILNTFQIIPFTEIAEHTLFALLLCMTLFIRNLDDIRHIIQQNTDKE
ncbi:hypothetical protein LBMAG36_17410 [Chlorobiota bacterium]|nr:hypothetical protein LBMAG36_17410 [Chlorobiota bacterium]